MTDTTREGFYRWVNSADPKELFSPIDAAYAAWQAAKADELAFLEKFMSDFYERDYEADEEIIRNRISHLKGESRAH